MNTFSHSRFLSSKKMLIDENIRLKKQNDALEEKLLNFDLIASQNEELKKVLTIRSKGNSVGGVITLYPPQSPFDVFDIELPENHAVSVGKNVRYGAIALGTIAEVYGTHARVILHSSPGVRTEGRLMKDGMQVTLIGKGGGNFTLSAPRDMEITAGDVITLGQNSDLVLARVGSVEEAETDSFKQVRLSIPTNIFSLRFVDVSYE